MSSPSALLDSHNRVIRDLRISITDRCNFNCAYCLPETEEATSLFQPVAIGKKNSALVTGKLPYSWKPRSQILTFEEIVRITRVAASFGVDKIRITGGEPLIRRNIESLISQIAAIGLIRDLSLTTNGTHFTRLAKRLKEAGLNRVTISLDSLDRDNFKKITGRDELTEVLKSISLAKSIGLTPLKVNAVIIRGLNDHEIVRLVRFALDEDIVMRFIEFMPLDSRKAWRKDHVVSGSEILRRIQSKYSLTRLPANTPSETSTRWSLGPGTAEVGIISPVTQPFCGKCNRIRLTADGKIRTCLFSHLEHDLKPYLRKDSGTAELASRLQQIVLKKESGHRINEANFVQPERTMSRIGG